MRQRPLSASSRPVIENAAYIDCHGLGLHSVQGAQHIISMLKARRTVRKLILSHNELRDEGCITLFTFLGSALGRKHPISEILLGSNEIGNAGLLAISKYLKNNLHLQELWLQNNEFIGDIATTTAFVEALNTSYLRTLQLSSNVNLSDSFAETFFRSLRCPHLHLLSISAIRLSAASLPHLIDYLCSPRCRLESFTCSANNFGVVGVRSITEAIKKHNFRLTKVDVYSNATDEDIGVARNMETWRETYTALTRILDRNKYLKRETEEQALRLLRYARPLLLEPSMEDRNRKASAGRSSCSESCLCIPSHGPSSSSTSKRIKRTSDISPLPIEIKHHILSFYAPTLSPAQRIRIYHYASSPATLPQLLPCLPSSSRMSSPGHAVCLPDPSTLGFGQGGKVWSIDGSGVDIGGGCATERCLGPSNSIFCHREEDMRRWLEVVGCDSYDPYDSDGQAA